MHDVFLYNGPLERQEDLRFIEFIAANRVNENLLLLLVTPGGNPDAAYKIARYLQANYAGLSCLIPGVCKSAGTLLAVGANELIFSPYGELGPLDVQLSKSDDLFGQESGLNISEAFRTVEARARATFHQIIAEIVSGSGGVISFQTASHCASEIVASLYGPIFGRIDPEEVGSRARAMRLGEDYGVRLNQRFSNLRQGALTQLSQSYSSHGFVIDKDEACALFERVRGATPAEKALIQSLGTMARFPGSHVEMQNLTAEYASFVEAQTDKEKLDAQSDSPANENADDATRDDSAGAAGAAEPNGGDFKAAG